jgi:hypothetical protein
MSSPEDISKQDIIQVMQKHRAQLLDMDGADMSSLVEMVYQIWWRWADFHLFVTSPVLQPFSPPQVVSPALIEGTGDQYEFVYPIVDYGDRLSTSKGLELCSAGLSMWKLYCTIEKMIFLFIERIKLNGGTTETEVQIAFGGHELAQRKAFESVINLSYNVMVTNFDPGAWGERYLQVVKKLADKGYGYPEPAPRDSYKRLHHASLSPKGS